MSTPESHQDETILLKIKRQFTTEEAVQSLLKMIHDKDMEIGFLKSDLSEAVDKAEKIRQERTMTKKQWMQEEVFIQMKQDHDRMVKTMRQQGEDKKMWMNKYFSLLAKTSNNEEQKP